MQQPRDREVRKLKETVDSFNTVLGNIYNELPGPSRLALSESGRKGGTIGGRWFPHNRTV